MLQTRTGQNAPEIAAVKTPCDHGQGRLDHRKKPFLRVPASDLTSLACCPPPVRFKPDRTRTSADVLCRGPSTPHPVPLWVDSRSPQ